MTWILIFLINTGFGNYPISVGHFSSQQDCQEVAQAIYQKWPNKFSNFKYDFIPDDLYLCLETKNGE